MMSQTEIEGDVLRSVSIELQNFRRSAQASAAESNAQESVSETPIDYPSGIKLVSITFGLILSIFLSALDQSIIATAIPSITDQFGSISNIAWYGSAYAITNTAYQSSWGRAYNYFNLKWTFLSAISIFALGNIICGASPNSETLILGRVVSGIGGGGIMTGSFIIIALIAKPEFRAAYMGIVGATFGCSSVVGPLMGGSLTDGPGWRWCFWVSLPISFSAAMIMLIFFSPPIVPKEATLTERIICLDLVGGTLVTGALSCFVLAMHWIGILSWKSAAVVLSITGFISLAILFFVNEWHMGSKAMIQSHLLKRRQISMNLVYAFCIAGVYFPLLYSLPVQFQSVHNDSASQSGIRLIPLILGISAFTIVSNGILTFWRHYNPLLLIGAISATIGVSLIYKLDEATSKAAWVGYLLLTACGIGLALQIPMLANQSHVSIDDVPAATSLTLFCENVGTSLCVAATEAAFTNGLLSSLSKNAPNVDPHAVLNAGATQIRNLFLGAEFNGILASYLEGCQLSHIVSVACGAAACLISLCSSGPSGMRYIRRLLRKTHEP